VPKRITNPLRAGLPSKIYLAAYGKPTSGYEIAQRVYGITSVLGERAQIPPTAKIYEWLKKLEKAGSVIRTEDGYFSCHTPLLNEIEKMLEVHRAKKLTALEKKILLSILDSREFRSYAGERTSKIDLREDVDAARELTELLVVLSLTLKGLKTEIKNPEILEFPELTSAEEFNKLWDGDMISVIEEKVKEKLKEIKLSIVRRARGAAIYQARIRESSLERDLEKIKSSAKDPEGLLALKLACVPSALLEEIENLSPVAVGLKRIMKRVMDALRK